MRRIRTASTRRLAAIAAAVVMLAACAGIAQAALGGASAPAPKPLDRAVYDALRAPAPQGITARIHFTNGLLPSGTLPEGSSSPLATGADGRLWLTQDGRVRLELQSDGGDAQIVADGKRFSVYDAASNTAYVGALPQSGKPETPERPATLAGVQRGLAHLGDMWSFSGARPGTTAGRPSYTVRITPKDDGGLLGAAELAWDAARGVPLRAAVYAQGQSSPVLELAATHIAYGPIDPAKVTATPPAGAKVTEISPPAGTPDRPQAGAVRGAAAVQRQLSFRLAVPRSLAGLPLKQVSLVKSDGKAGALSVYGQGLGAILVFQHPAGPASAKRGLGAMRLPRIAIRGATGSELATPLGTVLTFDRGGVSYLVAGSVKPLAAENAARGLR